MEQVGLWVWGGEGDNEGSFRIFMDIIDNRNQDKMEKKVRIVLNGFDPGGEEGEELAAAWIGGLKGCKRLSTKYDQP